MTIIKNLRSINRYIKLLESSETFQKLIQKKTSLIIKSPISLEILRQWLLGQNSSYHFNRHTVQ